MKTAALIAVAGIASIASAQSVTVNLTHDDADGLIEVNDSVTWTLSVEFAGFAADASASGGNMVITGNNAAGTSFVNATDTNGDGVVDSNDVIFDYTPVNGGNNGGLTNGAGIDFVSWTNSKLIFAFGGDPDIQGSPFVVGTFGWTALADGEANMGFGLGAAASAFVSIDETAFSTVNFNMADVAFNIDSLTVGVIPTPASAALLGLGGLVAIRRRR